MAHQLDLFSDPPASAPPPATSLKEMVAFYGDAVSDHPRRVKYRSATSMMARAIGLPLDQISTNPQALRPLIAKVNPAAAGIKPDNWKTIKSTFGAALRDYGVDVMASRSAAPFSPEWDALMQRIEERGLAIGLSRPVRYFSENDISPAHVTARSFEAFRAAMTDRSLLADAEKIYRQCVLLWNKAVATVPGWPVVRIIPVGNPRLFSFEWHEFSPAFVAEVEAFLSAKRNTDPLAEDHEYSRAISSATVDTRRTTLRIMASALRLSGRLGDEELTSLEVLTRLENVRAALRYLRDVRSKGQVTEGHINHAYLMRTIAKYWVKDADRAEALKGLIADLVDARRKGAAKGMTAKNSERLLQLDIPSNVDALIGLPEKVYRATRSISDPTNRESLRVMRALQVGILTFVPIRIRNLTELKLGAHLIDIGKGSKRILRIHLPAAITKTYRDYQAPLPRHLFPLLDAWIAVHRRKISPKASPYLFPNPRGELRSSVALSQRLQTFIKRETGLIINAHLFRHIAAKLYLDWDPSGIEIVRQLLGHRSIKTTLAVYAQLQTDPAFRRMEQALLSVGYAISPSEKRTGKGGRS